MAGRRDEPRTKLKTAEDDDGFLGRWSRRKAAARTMETKDAADPPDRTSAGWKPEDQDDSSPAVREPAVHGEEQPPAFDVSKLPDIDSLGPGSDFSPFMQAGVPSALKTKALRKLWRVKPELANLDGLLDYGEDLTGSFKVVDHLKTAYEVGRGFLRDQENDDPEKVTEDDDLKEIDETDRPRSSAASAGKGDEIAADTSVDRPISEGRPKDDTEKA